MGRTTTTGVDGAISVLQALSRADGVMRTADCLEQTGLPRASLHRIAVALAKHGLVETGRGTLRPGPAAAAFPTANQRSAAKTAGRRASRPDTTAAGHMQLPGTGPLPLTAPPRLTRKPRFRIGFSNASLDNPWRTALVHAIEYAAAYLGDHVDWLAVRHAGDDAARQAEHIDALVSAGVDGLLVSAAGFERVSSAISRAANKGVAIVMVDRWLGPGVPHLSYVTSSNQFIGATTARWLIEQMAGSGRIVMLPGLQAAEPARRRYRAALSALARFPDIEIVSTHWTGWRHEPAHAEVSRLLARGERIDGVWCDSGLQGVGAQQAFVDAGFGSGQIPPHTGGDLNLAYKLALRHDVPLAAVDYPPAMGRVAVETLYAALCGQWVCRRIDVPSDIILTRGSATASVQPTLWADDHVRWDLPDDLILHTGLGQSYSPRSFRIRYPGNSYNRSAAQLARVVG